MPPPEHQVRAGSAPIQYLSILPPCLHHEMLLCTRPISARRDVCEMEGIQATILGPEHTDQLVRGIVRGTFPQRARAV